MYRDEYHKDGSLVSYDGALIPLEDAQYRWERDEARQEMYEEAEAELDDEQYTWDDVKENLEKPNLFHDPRTGNVGATKPGDYRG